MEKDWIVWFIGLTESQKLHVVRVLANLTEAEDLERIKRIVELQKDI